MRSETQTDPTYGYTAHLPAVSFEENGRVEGKAQPCIPPLRDPGRVQSSAAGLALAHVTRLKAVWITALSASWPSCPGPRGPGCGSAGPSCRQSPGT